MSKTQLDKVPKKISDFVSKAANTAAEKMNTGKWKNTNFNDITEDSVFNFKINEVPATIPVTLKST